jgi:ferredoxin
VTAGKLAGAGILKGLDLSKGKHIHCKKLGSKTNTFMADIANRYPENILGKFYVDNQCIDCDLCRETAPDNFTRNDDGGYSYVFKQPTTPEEEAQCKEAMEGCPVEAIGNDGDQA